MVFGGGMTGALGWVARSLQVANIAGQTVQGVQALKDGDVMGAVQSFLNVGLVAAWGVAACTQSNILAWGLRTIHGVAAGQLVESSIGKFASGDWFGGFADLADAGANLYMMACFTGEMQVLTQRGWVRWDQVTKNDAVASCDENKPLGEIEFKRIAALFQTRARIWHVQVHGKVIRTTGEHPFYVWGKGWTAAKDLLSGDRLRGHDGRMMAVQEAHGTGVEEVVYNCAVEEYHTYFVGGEDWKFSVWAAQCVLWDY